MRASLKNWRVDFQGTGAEEVTFDPAFAQLTTILGTQVINEQSVRLFISSTEEHRDILIELLKQRDFSISAVEIEESRDWVKVVQDAWIPFHVGSFEIVPILGDLPSVYAGKQNQILLRPGVGFGTGHSQTTQTILLNLETVAALSAPPAKILDVGTGSGILALAAARLFSCATIYAIDINEAALENAIENVILNGLSERISLSLNHIGTFQDAFDLIIANVEIGVHLDLFDHYNRLTRPHSSLVVAGLRDSITAAQYKELLENPPATPHGSADKNKWDFTHSVENGEWKSFVFTKIA